MRLSTSWSFVAFVLVLLAMYCKGVDDLEPHLNEPDMSHWVDPTHMLSYDSSSRSMRIPAVQHQEQNTEKSNSPTKNVCLYMYIVVVMIIS